MTSLQAGFPKLDAPMVNPDGTVSIPWYRFLIALWNRTGASGGSPSIALDAITNIQGSLLYRGSTQWNGLNPGTNGYVLATDGAGQNPNWVQRVSSVGTNNGLTGGPITSTGTIGLAEAPAETLKGNNQTSEAVPTDLTVGQIKTMLQFVQQGDPAGGSLAGSYPNPTLGADVVGNTNLAQMPSNTVKANLTGAAANPADTTIAQLLTSMGFVPGTTGAYTLPGGLEVKWGTATGSSAVVFPAQFTTGLLGLWLTISAGTVTAGTIQSVWATAHSSTGFSAQTRQFDGTVVSDPGATFFWLAIGY